MLMPVHMDKPLKSETNGQFNARPTVTFPAIHCPVAGTKLVFCLVTEAHNVYEQLAYGCFVTLPDRAPAGVKAYVHEVLFVESKPDYG